MNSQEHAPDIVLAQETWLSGTWIKEINDITIIHHGPEEQPSQGKRGGLAIFLNQTAKKAWTEAGQKLTQPGCIVDNTTRILGITLTFQENQKRERTKISKKLTLEIINIYAPHNGLNYCESFDNYLDSICKSINPKHSLIIAGDLNAAIGRRNRTPDTLSDPTSKCLGPHGINPPKQCPREEPYISLMLTYDLRHITSYFSHRIHSTHYNNLTKQHRQLDYFLTPISLFTRTKDAHTCKAMVPSDHRAIMIKISLEGLKKQQKKKSIHINQSKLHDKEENCNNRAKYNEHVQQKVIRISESKKKSCPNSHGILTCFEYQKACHDSALELFSEEEKPNKGWFNESADILLPAISERNSRYEEWTKNPNLENLATLRLARKEVPKLTKEAYNKYFLNKEINLSKHDLASQPKEWWKIVEDFKTGGSHHWKQTNMFMVRNKNGKTASSEKENLKHFGEHLESVYNNPQCNEVDFSVLDEIKQRQLDDEIGLPPTFKEFNKARMKTKNGTSPGESGFTFEMLKALDDHNVQFLFQDVLRLWKGENLDDLEQWKHSNVKMLHKKGDTTNPNNYRGIALQESTTKIVSSIIANRLLTNIEKHGHPTQFGFQRNMGCTDALFLLRSVLQNRREYNLETHVLFVDLVKAFDTVNHDLLFRILKKYGIPESLISVIKSLHNDLKVNLKLSKNLQLEINYKNGVKQGDNMAPILFLYVIQAMSETLAPILEKNNVLPIDLLHYPLARKDKTQRGMLAGQKSGPRATQETLNIIAILFADDGAFLFSSRLDMVIGANLLFKHLKRFGLQMHIGTDGKPSKTEAMFFPASKPSKNELETIGQTSNTLPFPVFHGIITYCKSFKYLGAQITPCLSDEQEVCTRI
jgi:exonuclease III